MNVEEKIGIVVLDVVSRNCLVKSISTNSEFRNTLHGSMSNLKFLNHVSCPQEFLSPKLWPLEKFSSLAFQPLCLSQWNVVQIHLSPGYVLPAISYKTSSILLSWRLLQLIFLWLRPQCFQDLFLNKDQTYDVSSPLKTFLMNSCNKTDLSWNFVDQPRLPMLFSLA